MVLSRTALDMLNLRNRPTLLLRDSALTTVQNDQTARLFQEIDESKLTL